MRALSASGQVEDALQVMAQLQLQAGPAPAAVYHEAFAASRELRSGDRALALLRGHARRVAAPRALPQTVLLGEALIHENIVSIAFTNTHIGVRRSKHAHGMKNGMRHRTVQKVAEVSHA